VNPEEALSDKDNTVPLGALGRLWSTLKDIDEVVRRA
jgi:3-deoxy-D-manno-octulosonic acid (KDO) 8-phosphate synthase